MKNGHEIEARKKRNGIFKKKNIGTIGISAFFKSVT